ncbi:MAG TPA: VOC family protein [Candidatus Latescibacteria bacterium]|jgi:catechol 2,3-dioxygenase-like lactoylglutathione lyase family enzyme|nr:VOC family protein [Candidatus Latescibacterota bacterium]MDP7631440.1 VOC family protein [Candidatus Latescibacterota bacterium]HJN30386.1 VOC family protein [Candidatus Latescibacterota bacterium]|tara:strand:- start:524 stop:895 length:372 start_codon:yes stop_codon:yes gene_type:complete
MKIKALASQLRTTDLPRAIAFYTETLGFDLAFTFGDFYAGIGVGDHLVHLKLVDDADPSIDFVRGEHLHLHITVEGIDATFERLAAADVKVVEPVADREWGMREFIIEDPDAHTIHFAQNASS